MEFHAKSICHILNSVTHLQCIMTVCCLLTIHSLLTVPSSMGNLITAIQLLNDTYYFMFGCWHTVPLRNW